MTERPIIFSGQRVRAILEGRKTMTRRVVTPQPPARGVGMREHKIAFHTDDEGVNLYAYSQSAGNGGWTARCPYGQPGDRLWVKEAWAHRLDRDHLNGTQLFESGVRDAWYWADGPGKCCNTGCAGAAGRVRSSRFMPRWASRITLKVVSVRVERLQSINESDAVAEGCTAIPFGTWWQGYRDCGDMGLIHQVWKSNEPPEWMIEPKRMADKPHLDHTAVDNFKGLWDSINNGTAGKRWSDNPFVWVVEFKRV